jgi:aryl-alcohol dehydrogenase-like predicted oxidoreductase
MKYATLGKTEIRVSRIGLGANAVGGHNLYSNLDDNQGKRLVEEALDLGINFIDTADSYGIGRSEELIGEVLAQDKSRREKIVLATKGGNEKLPGGLSRRNNKPQYLRAALEASLRRLRTDYVDLYYIHYPDGETPFSESVGELVRMKEEGKIRAIGISNVTLEQLKEADRVGPIAALQMPYNMLERSIERDLLSYCAERRISFVPYGPLAYGILGGKYAEDFRLSPGDWRNRLTLFQPDAFRQALRKVEALKEIAEQKQTTISNLALAWLLTRQGVDTVIPGAKTPEQVAENAKAADVLLSEEDLKRIEQILQNSFDSV